MTRARKWLLGASLLVLVAAGLVIAAARMIPSDEELAARLAAALESSLGVKVTVGSLSWTLLPVAEIVVQDLVVATDAPIVVRRISLQPDLRAAWQRRLKIDTARVDGAVVPQLSLRHLGHSTGAGGMAGGLTPDELPLQRFEFSEVTWISRHGLKWLFDGDIDFDQSWRPRKAALRRSGFSPATDVALTRQGDKDIWDIGIRLGGGTANGSAQLHTVENGQLRLAGTLKPRGIEVSSALEAFGRPAPLAGKASGETTLSSSADSALGLARSLKTSTPFTMGQSTLLKLDIDRAIKTLGKEHAGKTPLDEITGKLETQNTVDGMIVQFKDIHAKSGSLTASGDARLFNRHIDAELAIDLVDGLVGVPLKLSGATTDVKVSVPGGAVAGAAIGTAVLPGIGTVIGARVGAAIGKIFGAGPAAAKSTPPPAPRPR